MTEYTARNGYGVRKEDGELKILWADNSIARAAAISTQQIDALREFFRHEEDERLGRWRWPESPDYVVRLLDKNIVRVTQESKDQRWEFSRSGCSYPSEIPAHLAASEYFAAHPEPKPWHDAKPGEVWLLTRNGVDEPQEAGEKEGKRVFWLITGTPGYTPEFSPDVFTAGRRIWPEDAS